MLLPALFHGMDLVFALVGGFTELHLGIVGVVWWRGRALAPQRGLSICLPLPRGGEGRGEGASHFGANPERRRIVGFATTAWYAASSTEGGNT